MDYSAEVTMVEPTEQSDRDEIRQILAANVRALDERIEMEWAGELAMEEERLQLTRLRTLAHLARQYRLLARDADLDEMEEEVNLLQEAMEHKRGDR